MKTAFKTMKTAFKTTLIAAFSLIAAIFAMAESPAGVSHDEALNRNLTIFNSIIKELEMNYVDSIKTDDVFEIAIAAMLETIDPYTDYLTDSGQENLQALTTGEYGGIGSYILERDGWVYINGPYEGSPAALAGLRHGDRILSIDSVSMKGKSSSEVSTTLKGVPGSSVSVEILRPWVADSIFTVNIERKKIQLPSVPYYGMAAPGIGVIKLESFMDKSPGEMRDAINQLNRNDALKGLILDLRGNGGGLVESAIEILSFFLPKGTEVLQTRGRNAVLEKTYKTTKSPILPNTPLVILIDAGSASASEITAGAIQDLDRGVIVGSRSFGKGLVQSTRPLPYGGLLKYTTSKYYIPSERLIQALDYSHRNEDGTVARTPDSLTNLFHTRAGREVRDGGGIKPDVELTWKNINNLIYRLAFDHRFFDFANRYAAEHDSIDPPSQFSITDNDFEAFKKSVDGKALKYEPESAIVISRLRDAIKRDGFDSDESQQRLDSLVASITHDINYDMDCNKTDIIDMLNREIAERYYFQKGRIEQGLKSDIGVQKAIEILSDPVEYHRLLTPVKK